MILSVWAEVGWIPSTNSSFAAGSTYLCFVCVGVMLALAASLLRCFAVLIDWMDWLVADVSIGVHNFLVCIEMFFMALFHRYAFGYEQYKSGALAQLIQVCACVCVCVCVCFTACACACACACGVFAAIAVMN